MPRAKNSKRILRDLEVQRSRVELKTAEIKLRSERLAFKAKRDEYRQAVEADPAARGVFYFHGEINDRSTAKLIRPIERYAYLHDGADITIYLDTIGGAALAGFALFDNLRALAVDGHEITTISRGLTASLGLVLLQAGDLRMVGMTSTLMLHEVSAGAAGKLHEMQDDLKRVKLLNRRLFQIIADRTDGRWTGKGLYAAVRAKDWWMGAEEAIDNRFADCKG